MFDFCILGVLLIPPCCGVSTVGPRIAWATRGTICRGHPRQWQGAAAVTSDDVHGY